jgi:hypothetical protein
LTLKLERVGKWLLMSTVCLFTSSQSCSAEVFAEFDAAVVLKKTIWADLTGLLPAIRLVLPNGTLTVVDSVLCQVGEQRIELLLALKENNPETRVILTETDCGKTATDLVKSIAGSKYDLLAYVAVSAASDGVLTKVTDAARNSDGTVSDGLFNEVRSYSLTSGQLTISLNEGAFSKEISLSIELVSGDLLVKGHNPELKAALRDADISKTFSNAEQAGNTKVFFSHEAVGNLVAAYLKDKPLPIEGTDGRIEVDSYSGEQDRASLHGKVTWSGFLFGGSATWSGPELLLSDYKVTSLKDCSSGNAIQHGLCNAQRQAETAAVEALAAGAWPKYKSTRLMPLNWNRKVGFSLYGKPLYLSGTTVAAGSSAKALTFTLSSYLGRSQ